MWSGKYTFFSLRFAVAISLCLLLASHVAFSAEKEKTLDIQIDGLSTELRNNVLAHLGAEQLRKKKRPINRRQASKLLDSSEPEIIAALQAYGFYQPIINVELDEASPNWGLGIEVAAGKQTTYSDVDVSIVGEAADNKKLAAFLIQKTPLSGQPLLHQQYAEFKSTIRKRATELGYLDGKYSTHLLNVNVANATASIELVFDSGPRYYFGEVSFEQSMLNKELAEKFVKPTKGEPFEGSKLIEAQLRLSETEYFESVLVNIHRDLEKDGHIPVSIVAAPRKVGAYKLSLGYGTDTGPRIGVGADIRRVNKRGHKFLNKLQLSELESAIASRYQIPIGDVRSESVDFSANLSQQNVNALDTREYSVTGSLNQNRWGGRRKISLEIVRETWNFDGLPSDSATLLIPALEYSYRSSNDPFFAAQGYSFVFTTMGAAENVLSDHSFARVDLFARYVRPLSERTRLLVRGEAGAIATDDFDGLPPSVRYFAGGSQSIRGYGYDDVSPLDFLGNEVGGKFLSTASVEIDYLFYRSFGAAVFVDAGNASNSWFKDPRYGAGVGFRYKSPAGMFRLDIAHPFDDPDKSVRIHLSFGIDL